MLIENPKKNNMMLNMLLFFTCVNLFKEFSKQVLDLISSHGSSQVLLKCFEKLHQCCWKIQRENLKNLQKNHRLVEPPDSSRRAT